MLYSNISKDDILSLEESMNILYMQDLLNESSILIESISNFVALSEAKESMLMKLKNILVALKNKIKELFIMFLDKVKELFTTDIKWLEDNKDTIFKLKVSKKLEIDIFPYWDADTNLNNFNLTSKFPRINPNNSAVDNSILVDLEDKETFRKKHFSNYFASKDDSNTLDEGLKKLFRGSSEEETFNGTVIQGKLPTMFTYCTNYKSSVSKLEKEYKILNERIDAVIKEIKDVDISAEEKEVEVPKDSEDKSKNESFNPFNLYLNIEECMYSDITPHDIELLGESIGNFNNLLYEMEIKSSGGSVGNSNTTKFDSDKAKKDAEELVTLKDSDKKNIKGDEDKAKLISKYRVYLSEYYFILSVKMTVMESKYKDYMKILRYLVRKSKVE